MHPMLTTAVKAARRAGNVITRGARDLDLLTVTAKGPKDFVSEVDRAAEAAIVETIHAVYPEHAILAEEGTGRGRNPDAEHLWIIDPLDGTTNFLHGFPQYCVSIALAHKGVVTQGVIFDPIRNDLFTATRGPRRLSQRPAHPRVAPRAPARLPDRHRLPVSGRQLSRHLPADDEGDDPADGRLAPARRRRAGPRVRRGRVSTTDSSRSASTHGTWPPAVCSCWKPVA